MALMHRIMERIKRAKSINSLTKDLETIERFTDVSYEICRLIVDNEWLITVLLYATDHLNRSEPHKKVLSNVLGIVLNLLYKTGTTLLFNREDIFKIAMKAIRFNGKCLGSMDPKANSIALNSRAVDLLLCLFQDSASLKVSVLFA